jgi:hypothetical protein
MTLYPRHWRVTSNLSTQTNRHLKCDDLSRAAPGRGAAMRGGAPRLDSARERCMLVGCKVSLGEQSNKVIYNLNCVYRINPTLQERIFRQSNLSNI